MNLRQKVLLASKSPSVDILFDDVLTHIKYLVAVVEEVIHFIILLAWHHFIFQKKILILIELEDIEKAPRMNDTLQLHMIKKLFDI